MLFWTLKEIHLAQVSGFPRNAAADGGCEISLTPLSLLSIDSDLPEPQESG